MIEYRNGDIFKQDDIDVIIHQANCHCRMGSGVAAQVKKYYPEAVAADKRTTPGDRSKLGTYTEATCSDGKVICNLYAQYNYANRSICNTDYDAFKKGLSEIKDDYFTPVYPNVFGVPDHIGCALAGGDWDIVKSIIKDIFGDSEAKIIICKYTG